MRSRRSSTANGSSARSGIEQFCDSPVDEGDVGRIGSRAGDMAPDRGNREAFGVWDFCGLELVVGGREIEIGLTRHEISFGPDGPQRFGEIAAIEIVRGNVAMLPGPQHG